MKRLEKGKFYGIAKKEFCLNGLTIVDSQFYRYQACPWHHHQNAHFAFTTKGNLVETHKKKQIQLAAGCLLYNDSDEPHCNSRYSSLAGALHIDIDAAWFKKYHINPSFIKGVKEIQSPIIKNNFFNIFKEIKYFDNASSLSIESLVVQSIEEMIYGDISQVSGKPAWVTKTKDLLYDRYKENISLLEIALEINIHPVYLCQQFPLHFHCTFGDYNRKIKIEKAVSLMLCSPHLTLTEIAYTCGFSDQSHFIRLFKKNVGITPLSFRKMISSS